MLVCTVLWIEGFFEAAGFEVSILVVGLCAR